MIIILLFSFLHGQYIYGSALRTSGVANEWITASETTSHALGGVS